MVRRAVTTQGRRSRDRTPAGCVAPDDVAEIAAATGAVLVGRRIWEVGARMAAEEPAGADHAVSGPTFLLTDRPLEHPDPDAVIVRSRVRERSDRTA